MKRTLLGSFLALGIVLAPLWSMPHASAATKPDSCPTGKPMVVNAYDTVRNIADLGADGHVWALDTYTETVQIWRIGTNAYCVKRHDVGSFTSFAGLSPEGTGMISAGVTGSFEGTIYLRIYGTFAPTVPTTGFIGDFDGQCQQDGTCPGTVPRVVSLYFSRAFFRDPGSFLGVFDGGSCGTWTQTPNGASPQPSKPWRGGGVSEKGSGRSVTVALCAPLCDRLWR
jgi:hypothetical protein